MTFANAFAGQKSTHTERCDRQEDHDAATTTLPTSPSSRKLASNEGCVSKGKHLGNRCNSSSTSSNATCVSSREPQISSKPRRTDGHITDEGQTFLDLRTEIQTPVKPARGQSSKQEYPTWRTATKCYRSTGGVFAV